MVKLEFIDQNNAFLPDIINLGKKYSVTLGFMPEGGFIEHAQKGNIIIAYEKLNLFGYLMFRLVNRYQRVTIVHLCIKEEYRGQNISTKLLDTLRERYKHIYSGISLTCRTDYTHATKLWQRYGFTFQREERSRSVNEKYINKWWYDFNLPDLFSFANDASIKIKALLDSNIIFKLRDEENAFSDTSGVSTLLSDWLSDEVEYFYSPEIRNEYLRDKNKERAEKTKIFLSRFNETRFDIEFSKVTAKKLKSIITGNSENNESDRNQIASCVAAGMSYFITLDDGILSKKDEIESEYDVQIFKPHSFYLEIDQLINKELYSPKKIAGVTSHEIKKFGSDDFDHCIDMFLVKSLSEKRPEFIDCINSVLSSENSEIKIIKYESLPIAIFSLKYEDKILFVPFIRVVEKYKNKLTLFMQIIFGLINESIKKEVSQIVIIDKCILEYQKVILNKLGFIFITNVWKKLSINMIVDNSQLDMTNYGFINSSISETLMTLCGKEKEDALLELEHKLFPIKFSDLDIPCYIIPVIPYWAGQLFDENISNQTLFGANPEKLWNIENVYYRHTRPINEIAPARILWYASKDKNTERSQSIIGTSYLNEVMTDKPKILFQKNKHYGIYEWRNIFELCNKNIETPIRALRFSHTEVFQRPVEYQKIQQILVLNNRKRNTFPSPVKINKNIFFEIYRSGIWQK